jgi:arylsulfatase A-like enzyme
MLSKMSRGSRLRTLLIALAFLGLAGAIALEVWRTYFAPPTDDAVASWPIGSVEDIERLADRDDLNVLFILVDTLRADRLSAYGYERETSPNLDRLASLGVRFDRHLAQSSWTKASMASLWTGFNPTRTGVRQHDDIIPEAAVTAAERFQEAGFRTVGLYRNGWVAPTFGFQQGFDIYTRPPSSGIPRSIQRKNPVVSRQGTDDDVIEAGLEFLRLDGHTPWFLYMHLMDLHEYTYDDESAIFGGAYSDIYDNSIRWTDTGLGIMMDWLYEWGFLKNTVIVIASDHGEAFRERGFEGHARFLYRETTEVPLIIVFPFRLEPGVTVKSRTRNIDIWPTVFDLLGLDAPEESDGVSLKPEILDAARYRATTQPERMAFAQLNQNWARRGQDPVSTESLVDGPIRYVRRVSRGEVLEELFDSRTDPQELNDVAEEHPEVLARMRAETELYLGDEPVWGAPEVREINELELNQLRALGYRIP